MEYILGDEEEGCIFCKALSGQDNLTLYKGKVTMVIMNKFPYINGHLLVAPIAPQHHWLLHWHNPLCWKQQLAYR